VVLQCAMVHEIGFNKRWCLASRHMGEDCGLQASRQGYRTGRVFLALTKHGNGSGSTGFKERYCIGNTLGKGVTSSLGSAAWAKQIDILGGGFKHFLFSPHLGKIPILTNIFQRG